jgi:hypothetical protein
MTGEEVVTVAPVSVVDPSSVVATDCTVNTLGEAAA